MNRNRLQILQHPSYKFGLLYSQHPDNWSRFLCWIETRSNWTHRFGFRASSHIIFSCHFFLLLFLFSCHSRHSDLFGKRLHSCFWPRQRHKWLLFEDAEGESQDPILMHRTVDDWRQHFPIPVTVPHCDLRNLGLHVFWSLCKERWELYGRDGGTLGLNVTGIGCEAVSFKQLFVRPGSPLWKWLSEVILTRDTHSRQPGYLWTNLSSTRSASCLATSTLPLFSYHSPSGLAVITLPPVWLPVLFSLFNL